jgi:hypothetical protein
MSRGAAVFVAVGLVLSACVVDSDTLDEGGSGPEAAPADFGPVPTVTSTGLPPVVVADKTIQVHWHVIRQGIGLAHGDIPDSQIQAQIDVLNAAYVFPSFRFVLASTDRTTNTSWFYAAPGSAAETAMKTALWAGDEDNWEEDADQLNVYSLNTDGSASLGWASAPNNYTWDPMDDGVVVLYSSLPGGNAAPYNLGDQLVGLTGTWLGLLHTFNGGCNGSGDQVSDTPAEKTPAYGCPTGRNSCTGETGLDPITNYMDYTDDACMNNFTAGQYTRMKAQYALYRADP